MALGVIDVVEVVAGHGQSADQRGVLYSCDAASLLNQRVEEALAMALLAAGIGVERDFSGEDLIGVEAGIDARQAVEAVQEQAGGSDDDDGKRNLADDEGHRGAEAGSFADDAE